ncbi:MAG: antibiotic biosynthesis monooxygenase family protein [Roseinatronobacter sp.]
MYLTINRFKVRPGQEDAFEEIWTTRESKLPELDGFVEFHLFRGASSESETTYLSHTLWRDKAAFDAWARSQNFRGAHKGVRSHEDIYLGPPELEIYDSVQCIRSQEKTGQGQ